MKKIFSLTIIVFVCAALLSGCGGRKKGKFTEEQMQKFPLATVYDLPSASGPMVLTIYTEAVSSDDILNLAEKAMKPAAAQFAQDAFESRASEYISKVVEGKVTDILIYQEAKKLMPDNNEDQLDKAVNAEVTRFVASYDNNYALAEKKIKEMGMDWRSFRDYQKKLITMQYYISKSLKDERRFAYQELVAYYNKVKDEQFCQRPVVEFSLIDIIPNKLNSDKIDENESAEDAARRLATEAFRRAEKGEDFAQLAREYSQGPLAQIGGAMKPITVGEGSLPSPYDVLETIAVEMKPGEIKGSIENQGHLFIVKLVDYKPGGCTPFEEVQKRIEDQLQFEYRQKKYSEFVNQLVHKAQVKQMDQFIRFCTKEAWNRWSTKQTAAAITDN